MKWSEETFRRPDDLTLSAGGSAALFGVPEDGDTSVEYLVTADRYLHRVPGVNL